MANVELGWEVEGIIQADESVSKMLDVIESKSGKEDSGTFWCWDGRVSIYRSQQPAGSSWFPLADFWAAATSMVRCLDDDGAMSCRRRSTRLPKDVCFYISEPTIRVVAVSTC